MEDVGRVDALLKVPLLLLSRLEWFFTLGSSFLDLDLSLDLSLEHLSPVLVIVETAVLCLISDKLPKILSSFLLLSPFSSLLLLAGFLSSTPFVTDNCAVLVFLITLGFLTGGSIIAGKSSEELPCD